jgi:hypothetical protein
VNCGQGKSFSLCLFCLFCFENEFVGISGEFVGISDKTGGDGFSDTKRSG